MKKESLEDEFIVCSKSLAQKIKEQEQEELSNGASGKSEKKLKK